MGCPGWDPERASEYAACLRDTEFRSDHRHLGSICSQRLTDSELPSCLHPKWRGQGNSGSWPEPICNHLHDLWFDQRHPLSGVAHRHQRQRALGGVAGMGRSVRSVGTGDRSHCEHVGDRTWHNHFARLKLRWQHPDSSFLECPDGASAEPAWLRHRIPDHAVDQRQHLDDFEPQFEPDELLLRRSRSDPGHSDLVLGQPCHQLRNRSGIDHPGDRACPAPLR